MPLRDIDTGTAHLQARLEAGVLTLTLDRPEARNAMSIGMLTALSERLALAETNDDVRCVVLTGTGKAFCAGGDVKGMAGDADGAGGAATIDGAIHRQRLVQRATAGKLFRMPKPMIAAINGAAAGASCPVVTAPLRRFTRRR